MALSKEAVLEKMKQTQVVVLNSLSEEGLKGWDGAGFLMEGTQAYKPVGVSQ
ncbi:MAG TPA: hypothetical protein VIJ93_14290 [bacterium]